MALWKKNISGQGDPPGPLGKYITMYNKAVKTLGTDNPEVLKNFFASQQYSQNNTQVQQNNNINKAPQPKESKAGNIAGDVGTLALSTLQNFGMNIPGDVIKTVAPKAAILDVLPQTTKSQYVKQRNQSLGQNIKDVADATNTVAAFEVGAPLATKASQTVFKYASPYVKPIVNSVKNRLFKSPILPIEQNLKDLQYAKDYYSKFGYDIPENIAEIAKSTEQTDKTIQGLVEQHNTFVRGVSTNWAELEKRNPEILRHLEGKGIDWKNNPQAAAEYMATHVPINTGYGRAGFGKQIENMDALYTSNSIPTAEGYTYGDGYIVKTRKPLDFNSKNRIEWIENNKLDYDEITSTPNTQNLNDFIAVKDHYLNNPSELIDIIPENFEPKFGYTRKQLINESKPVNSEIIKIREDEIRKTLHNLLGTNENISLYGLENMKKPIRKMESTINKESGDITQYLDDLPNDIYPKVKNDLEIIQKNVRDKYKEQLKNIDDKIYKYKYGTIDWFKARQEFQGKVTELNKELHTEVVKTLKNKHNITPNQYAHYLHIGVPGQKVLEPLESIKITPEIWKNKSRAHTNVYSKGLSAGVKLLPTTLGSYGLYKSKKP